MAVAVAVSGDLSLHTVSISYADLWHLSLSLRKEGNCWLYSLLAVSKTCSPCRIRPFICTFFFCTHQHFLCWQCLSRNPYAVILMKDYTIQQCGRETGLCSLLALLSTSGKAWWSLGSRVPQHFISQTPSLPSYHRCSVITAEYSAWHWYGWCHHGKCAGVLVAPDQFHLLGLAGNG